MEITYVTLKKKLRDMKNSCIMYRLITFNFETILNKEIMKEFLKNLLNVKVLNCCILINKLNLFNDILNSCYDPKNFDLEVEDSKPTFE